MTFKAFRRRHTSRWPTRSRKRRGMLATGSPERLQLQQALAGQMRGMFGVVPRRSDEWLMFDKAGVFGLADDLTNDGPHWSPGQYSAALASLLRERS